MVTPAEMRGVTRLDLAYAATRAPGSRIRLTTQVVVAVGTLCQVLQPTSPAFWQLHRAMAAHVTHSKAAAMMAPA